MGRMLKRQGTENKINSTTTLEGEGPGGFYVLVSRPAPRERVSGHTRGVLPIGPSYVWMETSQVNCYHLFDNMITWMVSYVKHYIGISQDNFNKMFCKSLLLLLFLLLSLAFI